MIHAIDYYTRWIEACKIPFQTSSAIISAMKSVFSRQGVLKKVRSDNASYFVSSEFQTFACSWVFKTATSSPRYAQSYGLAEMSDKDGALLS